MRQFHTLLLSLAILGAAVTTAWSQSTVPPDPPATGTPTSPNVACAPNTRSPTTGSGASGDTLSDRLAQSKGVLCPPDSHDKEMAVPAPETGHMKVIPPPGAPGGDPSIQPK